MPRASGADVKRWLQDHDTDVIDETPPDQNTWYELFDAEDVRLLVQIVFQTNDETAAKDIEIRWTIDGNVYFTTVNLAHNTDNYVNRNAYPSSGGTLGLSAQAAWRQGAYRIDKRGLDFKVEVRMTSVPGTNQRLRSYAIRETLEIT